MDSLEASSRCASILKYSEYREEEDNRDPVKRRMRKLVGVLLSFTMCAGVAFSANAETLEEAQQRQKELQEQKEAAEQELDSIVSEINEMQEKLETKEAEIETAENDLIQAKADESEQYESMKIRIKYMYETGGVQFFEVLAQSSSIGDFLNNAEYVAQLSEYDRAELIKYQETVQEIEDKEAALELEYEELDALRNELIDKQAEVEAELADNEEELAEVQTLIDDAKRRQEEQRQSGGNFSGSYTGNVVSGNGYFTHPCPGMTYQSSYFGEIRSFSSRPHTGNDYAAPTGTPTYAAASGTVIAATYSNSAGNYVAISHGNGLVTKYMHHVSICVSAGQHVEKGQQIGWVGSTGNSTGPHLHFQVEENRVPVNPDKYL